MKTKTKLLVYLLFAICLTSAHAQQALVASGGNGSNLNGSVEYSVGQVVYTTNSGPTGSISQGVQQPYTFSTLGLDDFTNIRLQMMVFPNPTTTSINLKIEDLTPNTFSYQLFDLTGKLISGQSIDQSETPIALDNLPLATYFLHVSDHTKTIKRFKIIKNK